MLLKDSIVNPKKLIIDHITKNKISVSDLNGIAELPTLFLCPENP